ncbi:MAG: KpsF/GutQ family sugar-phosphate isomerase, partial [Deltaproteobacteria bacterium]
MKKDRSLSVAARVLEIEADAIKTLIKRLDRNFSGAIELILGTTGKVVVTGMGKSGIICQKIASTLASTGTPSFFLHPAEGMHGDLGMIMRNDILLAVSNSGSTDELIRIIPAIKRLGLKMIAMTGKNNSPLAKYADVTLDVGVEEEACPLGLAPTASTTATLAMGDALAVALLERRGFKAEDFAALHPAGNLGLQLMKVKDLMHTGDALPCVARGATMMEAIMEMTAKRMGVTGVFKPAPACLKRGGARPPIETFPRLRHSPDRDIRGQAWAGLGRLVGVIT